MIDTELLKTRLAKLDITITDLAAKCLVSREHMSSVINGHAQGRSDLAGRIAIELNLTANEVLGLPREHGLGVDS